MPRAQWNGGTVESALALLAGQALPAEDSRASQTRAQQEQSGRLRRRRDLRLRERLVHARDRGEVAQARGPDEHVLGDVQLATPGKNAESETCVAVGESKTVRMVLRHGLFGGQSVSLTTARPPGPVAPPVKARCASEIRKLGSSTAT